MDEIKAKIADAFKNFDDLKTPACLDAKTLGLLAENQLPERATAAAEGHIQSCLYCLNKLINIKELLYLATEAEPVSPELERKLTELFLKNNQEK